MRSGGEPGHRCARACGTPLRRQCPVCLARSVMGPCGLALPLAAARLLCKSYIPLAAEARHPILGAHALVFLLLAVVAILGFALVKLHGRVDGWRVALLIVVLLALHSVAS